jgi:hypothetical protein
VVRKTFGIKGILHSTYGLDPVLRNGVVEKLTLPPPIRTRDASRQTGATELTHSETTISDAILGFRSCRGNAYTGQSSHGCLTSTISPVREF